MTHPHDIARLDDPADPAGVPLIDHSEASPVEPSTALSPILADSTGEPFVVTQIGRATVERSRHGASGGDFPRVQWLSGTVRTAARTWSHSLQLRVAVTTLVVTGVVVLIIGIFLVDQISGGVLRAKRTAAIAQVESGKSAADQALALANFADVPSVGFGVNNAKASLSASGTDAGLFRIAIKSNVTNQTLAPVFDVDPVPIELRRIVQRNNLAMQYARVQAFPKGPQVDGLIVGEPVQAQGGLFEIYYLFPLAAEQDTIALVQRTVLLAGLGLVLFVAMIAVIVTRQVVRPVRVAARTAARLAAGDLSQRIRVRGTDDIAQLGQSFNDMAGSLQRQIRRLEDLSRLQRRFTSDVSHELRTPLTTIRMAAEVLHTRRPMLRRDHQPIRWLTHRPRRVGRQFR